MRTARSTLALLVLALAAPSLHAEGLTLPRQGDNQRGSIRQRIGIVEVAVEYSSPDVHAPDGSDRRGKIWGQLVPYGFTNLGFGTCGDQCPWRGGADENTVFATSHDVEIEGARLPAGRYGLHFLPGPESWTVIFSRVSTNWGSFFYDEADDALRVTVTPHANEYREWLTYEFTDRHPEHATLELQWESLAVPIRIAVPDLDELYYRQVTRELRTSPGFEWRNWVQAAQFCLQRKIHLDTAEQWARYATNAPFVGEANFQTLSTLADALDANGKGDEAAATRDKALRHRSASPSDIHQYARIQLGQGRRDLALHIFEVNAELHPGEWPVEFGLMRGYAAQGDAARALAHGRKALDQAPDPATAKYLQGLLDRLSAGDTAIN